MGVTVVMASVNLINVHKSFGGDAHVVKGVNISIMHDWSFLLKAERSWDTADALSGWSRTDAWRGPMRA